MSICKIGETKIIKGKMYRKGAVSTGYACQRCAFIRNDGCALLAAGRKSPTASIEDGGRECYGSYWILADDQPEAPTATPPRHEVREQRRFQAAVAAMQGYCAHLHIASEEMSKVAKYAVEQADALLVELDRTGAK